MRKGWTLQSARSFLRMVRLTFGDSEQILAVEFLHQVERASNALRNCPHERVCEKCDGSGQTFCSSCEQDRDCPECGGSGISTRCSCFTGICPIALAEGIRLMEIRTSLQAQTAERSKLLTSDPEEKGFGVAL